MKSIQNGKPQAGKVQKVHVTHICLINQVLFTSGWKSQFHIRASIKNIPYKKDILPLPLDSLPRKWHPIIFKTLLFNGSVCMVPELGLLPGPWKQSWTVFQRWWLRRILQIPFSAHVTNSAIYQRADVIRDGAEQETPALRPHCALRRRAGPRESSEGNDWAPPKNLEEACWTSSTDLAERRHDWPAPSEPWSKRGLEKGTEQRPMAAGHRNGNASPRGTPLMMKTIYLMQYG